MRCRKGCGQNLGVGGLRQTKRMICPIFAITNHLILFEIYSRAPAKEALHALQAMQQCK